MSNYICLLFMLAVYLGAKNSSTAQHDSNTGEAARSVQWRTEEAISDQHTSPGPKSRDTEVRSESYITQSSKKKNKQKQVKTGKQDLKTKSFVFDNFKEFSRFDMSNERMFYEIKRSAQRLFNRFFYYSEYELDKQKDGCASELVDTAVLGLLVSIVFFIIQLIVHGYHFWHCMDSKSFGIKCDTKKKKK